MDCRNVTMIMWNFEMGEEWNGERISKRNSRRLSE